MEIHHFPEVQILGNHAQIREGKHYIDLGIYNSDGSFEWSPEGIRRRDALLSTEVVEEESVEEPEDAAEEESEDSDPLESKLAEARERNAARNKKQKAKAK